MKTIIMLFFVILHASYCQWVPCNNGLYNKMVTSLTVIDTNLYAGTYSSGVFLSSDSAANWKNIGITNRQIRAIAGYENYLVAMTSRLYPVNISSDKGATWENIENYYNFEAMCLLVKDKIFYAGTSNGIRISTDNGRNWNK